MTTTKAAHTAGPVAINSRIKGNCIEIYKEGKLNVGPLVYIPHHGKFSEANAELIAEAFNVATETGMTPRQIVDALNETRADYQRMVSAIRQRDESIGLLKAWRAELLAALEAVTECAADENRSGNLDLFIDQARAAIAKATGEK